MALFSKKPAAKAKVVAPKATDRKVEKQKKADKKDDIKAIEAKVVSTTKKAEKFGGLDLNQVLLRPHITEKATDLSEQNVFAFEISLRANKMHVRQAVEKFYKVKPIKVAVIRGMAKYMKNPRTGRMQVKKAAMKKALVFLKKGDKIDFV